MIEWLPLIAGTVVNAGALAVSLHGQSVSRRVAEEQLRSTTVAEVRGRATAVGTILDVIHRARSLCADSVVVSPDSVAALEASWVEARASLFEAAAWTLDADALWAATEAASAIEGLLAFVKESVANVHAGRARAYPQIEQGEQVALVALTHAARALVPREIGADMGRGI